MMRRRAAVGRGRPGLVGTMARTAVIAGTATATAGAVNRRQDRKAMEQQQEYEAQMQMADMQQQLSDLQAQEAYAATQPPAAVPSSAAGSDLMQQLQSLSSMKSQGLLSDEEFAAAKAKLLGG